MQPNQYPEVGEPVLLVYRECPCGWWCATREGDVAPVCPICGMNPMPTSVDRPKNGLAFAARLGNEAEVAREVAGERHTCTIHERDIRHWSPADLLDELGKRGLPDSPMWHGHIPPWYPGPADAEDDWPAHQWTEYGREKLGLERPDA